MACLRAYGGEDSKYLLWGAVSPTRLGGLIDGYPVSWSRDV